MPEHILCRHRLRTEGVTATFAMGLGMGLASGLAEPGIYSVVLHMKSDTNSCVNNEKRGPEKFLSSSFLASAQLTDHMCEKSL